MNDNKKKLLEATDKVIEEAKRMDPRAYFDKMVATGIIDPNGQPSFKVAGTNRVPDEVVFSFGVSEIDKILRDQINIPEGMKIRQVRFILDYPPTTDPFERERFEEFVRAEVICVKIDTDF